MKIAANQLPRSKLLLAFVIGIGLLIAVFATLLRPSLAGAPSPEITLDEFIALTNSGRLHPSINTDQRAAHCRRYTDSENFVQRKHTLTISPKSNWVQQIENAKPDTEIILLDGRYQTEKHAVLVDRNTTIRSSSQNANAVTIAGQGYDVPGEGLMIIGNDVTIADLSITAMRDHAISIKPQDGANHSIQIYNVNLYDIGTQHIKLNVGGSNAGLIACSSVGYSENGAKGDYNGAIDLHEASNWTVRDNTIYNIRGDGSGCNVDTDCGKYHSGPAILVWNNAYNTTITRNRIFNSYRNIALGLGRGHENGMVDQNIIVQATPGDAGIELQTTKNTLVQNNTVILAGRYRGAIEYRDSSNIDINNNRVTSDPFDRGNNHRVRLHENLVIRELFEHLTGE